MKEVVDPMRGVSGERSRGGSDEGSIKRTFSKRQLELCPASMA